MLKVFNTLSKKLEPFIPLEKGKVKMYVCGPTVYGPAHIGHARTYIAFDIIRRYLEFKGFKVNLVVNITDVHDDMIKQANKENITIFELAERNIPIFLRDLEALRIKKPSLMPRVTQHINEIIQMIKVLQEKGYAYETEDGVYFRVSKFKEYGKLSGIKMKKRITGTRVDTDKYEKQDKSDFALWKKAKPNEPFWESPWGKGRPGWHIECSVMSTKYLGEQFDIHGGAVDLIFPHHENEICQSEACYGKRPFVKYWLHSGFLTVNGEKMSKSLGNFITIPELLKKHDAMSFRFFVASLHYRSRVDYNEEAVQQADKNLKKWNELIQNLLDLKGENKKSEVKKIVEKAKEDFIQHMDEDFNLPNAWASLYDFQAKINSLLYSQKMSKKDSEEVISFLKELNNIFDFFSFQKQEIELPKDLLELIKRREELRKQKKFEEADKIRTELEKKGITLIDTKEGVKWKKN
ncbi:MAG: cysteine--tRNA ligase [Candidatus Diapherotrites archaeon]